MNSFSSVLATAALTAAAALSAGAASATITTFADYTAIGTNANIAFKNSGPGASGGSSGALYTVASGNSTTPGTANVSFSFLQPQLQAEVNGVTAAFTLSATEVNTSAITVAGFQIQPGLVGSFSFLSTAPITIGAVTYAAGSNLLSGTFDDSAIFGRTNGSSGSLTSQQASSISYSSDFVTFATGSDYGLALNFSAIIPALTSEAGKSLRSFRGVSNGSFASDPAPGVGAVPEPATWSLMILGIGMLGGALRVNARKNAGMMSIRT